MNATKLYWKDEGGADAEPFGPLMGVDEPARDADPNIDPDSIGMPFGYEPEWLIDYGWVTLNEARIHARTLNIELEES